MKHLDSEDIAGLALGENFDDAPDAQAHLSACFRCRAELVNLQELVVTGQESNPAHLLVPPPSLLKNIEAELAEPASIARRSVDQQMWPRRAAMTPGVPHRRVWLVASAAAAVGLLVGAGAVFLAQRDAVEIVAATPLTALPGKTGSGEAQLVRRGGVKEIRVSVQGGVATNSFRELWLMDPGGQRMVSLGILPAIGTGTYPLPPTFNQSLAPYTTVDVSVEANDGNSAHSQDSLVRGSLAGQ